MLRRILPSPLLVLIGLSGLVPSLAPAAAQQFGPARLQTGFAPFRAHSVATDLDGDGDPDLLWCESLGSRVLWMENDGAGRFFGTRWIGAAASPSDGVGTAVAPFDMDEDGDLDVVVARTGFFTDDGLGWHENLGGEVFGPYTPLGYAVSSASVLRVRDVDGDGDGDLLFSVEGEGPAWIENDGGQLGTLRTVRPWPLELFELDVADLDGDGRRDIVWTESFGAGTRWCRALGPGAPGGAAYDPPVELSGVTATAAGMRVADADGDGDLDVVLATRAPSELIVVEALGSGTFAVPTVAALLPSETAGLELIDLDGDGDLDAVTVSLIGAIAEARENLGGLQFGAPAPSQLLDLVGPGAVAGSADFDGDGTLDPWFAAGSFHWIPGNGTAVLGDRLTPGTSARPDLRAAAGDVDGDGAVELVAADSSALHLFEGPGDGLAAVRTLPLGFAVTDAPHVVDLDGDGDDDVLVGGGSAAAGSAIVQWLENNGALELPVTLWTGAAQGGARLRTGDADGDGLTDLFVARPDPSGGGGLLGTWLLQGPARTFTESAQSLSLPGGPFEAADLDGDGLTDVVALGPAGIGGPPDVLWFASQGAGSVGAGLTLLSVDVGSSASPIAASDIDGDGDDDVVYFDAAQGQVVVALSQGTGAFAPPLALGGAAGAPEIVLGDVDGDGDDDVVVHDGDWVRVFPNEGGGAFGPPTLLAAEWDASAVFVADFDGDADGDLVQLSPRGVVLQESEVRLGRATCLAEMPGSNGLRPRLTAASATGGGLGPLQLQCDRLRENTFGLFLVGSAPDKASLAGGIGTRCIGGATGRFAGPGEIQSSGPLGMVQLTVDPCQLPTPTGFEAVERGTTRWFQYWTRDFDAAGAATSNFSSAIAVTFR